MKTTICMDITAPDPMPKGSLWGRLCASISAIVARFNAAPDDDSAEFIPSYCKPFKETRSQEDRAREIARMEKR